MTSTDIIVVTTESAKNDRDPKAHADYFENLWNQYIDNGSYSITVDSLDHAYLPHVYNPPHTCDALGQVQSDPDTQTLLNDYNGGYDAVCAIDNSTYSDGWGGCAYQSRAGTDYGVAYVTGDGGKKTTGQELGHVYGGKHADNPDGESTFENFGWFSYTVMGNGGQYDCQGDQASLYSESRFSDCTTDALRDYVDNNL